MSEQIRIPSPHPISPKPKSHEVADALRSGWITTGPEDQASSSASWRPSGHAARDVPGFGHGGA